MTIAEYCPAVFDAPNVEAARQIILTQESGQSTDERWSRETPFLAEMIDRHLSLSSASVLLDFGCGIGRLAKEMVARTGCRVVGVDISANQRSLAPHYVGSDRFMTCSPDMLIWMIESGLRFDGALAVWVLQHCLRPELDADIIARGLRDGGRLFVVNERGRCVPAMVDGSVGWINDSKSVREILLGRFAELDTGRFDEAVMPASHADTCFWSVLEKAT